MPGLATRGLGFLADAVALLAARRRVGREVGGERRLRAAFGNACGAYAARVKRFVPDLF